MLKSHVVLCYDLITFCSRVGWACEGLYIYIHYFMRKIVIISLLVVVDWFVQIHIVFPMGIYLVCTSWQSQHESALQSSLTYPQHPIHIGKMFWATLTWLTSPLQVKNNNWQSCFLSNSCLRKTSFVHCSINWEVLGFTRGWKQGVW